MGEDTLRSLVKKVSHIGATTLKDETVGPAVGSSVKDAFASAVKSLELTGRALLFGRKRPTGPGYVPHMDVDLPLPDPSTMDWTPTGGKGHFKASEEIEKEYLIIGGGRRGHFAGRFGLVSLFGSQDNGTSSQRTGFTTTGSGSGSPTSGSPTSGSPTSGSPHFGVPNYWLSHVGGFHLPGHLHPRRRLPPVRLLQPRQRRRAAAQLKHQLHTLQRPLLLKRLLDRMALQRRQLPMKKEKTKTRRKAKKKRRTKRRLRKLGLPRN
jgi:hypothetical protein